MPNFIQDKDKFFSALICPSNIKNNLFVSVIKFLLRQILSCLLKVLYVVPFLLGVLYSDLTKKYCKKEIRSREYVKNKIDNVFVFLFSEEPSFPVLILLSIGFVIGFGYDLYACENSTKEIVLKTFFLGLNILWLFHSVARSIIVLLIGDNNRYHLKNGVSKNFEDCNKNVLCEFFTKAATLINQIFQYISPLTYEKFYGLIHGKFKKQIQNINFVFEEIFCRTDDDIEENVDLPKTIREILDAEAEAYQEEKQGYFKHVEKMAQKIHSIYKIENNADMDVDFFANFAHDLKYDLQVLDEDSSKEWPTGLNAIVFNNVDPGKRKIVLSKFSTKDKRTMLSLLHELGHALVGTHNVIKNGHAETKSTKINRYREELRNERDANYFAAAMLCCEYKFKKLLNVTHYDLISIMRDQEYFGLSYETIAHRAASLSEIRFHAFKITIENKIIKKYTCSGLDFNFFSDENIRLSSANFCFTKNKKFHVGDGIYTQISMIPNKAKEAKEYFCFAKELPRIIVNGKKTRVAYVMGCTVQNAEDRKLCYYERHINKK